MTPAGTSNELDVQNEWEETHCSSGVDHFFFRVNIVLGMVLYHVIVFFLHVAVLIGRTGGIKFLPVHSCLRYCVQLYLV